MPTREEVLRWYDSVKTALTEAGLDLNNPADLLRVRAVYLDKWNDDRGVYQEQDADFKYAFMAKKKTDDLSQMREYEVKRPEISREDQMTTYPQLVQKYSQVSDARDQAFQDLTEARKQKRPLDEIKRLEEAYDLAEQKRSEAEEEYVKGKNALFAEHDRWMITNPRLFDPERDYDQIESLYERAEKGLLFVEELNPKPGHLRQIVVKEDGTGAVTKDMAEVDKLHHTEISDLVDVHPNPERRRMLLDEYSKALERVLEGKTPEEKQALYEKYGMPEPLEKLPERPTFHMEEPRNPHAFSLFGIRSWFGRTFLGNREPYEAYDRYQTAYNEFRQQEADYEAHHEEWQRQVIERNEKRTEVYEMILDNVYREDYPEGTKNVGRLRAGIEVFEQQIHSTKSEEQRENVYNMDFEFERLDRNLEILYEGHEHPESFDEKGNRKEKPSMEYWKQRGPISEDMREALEEEQQTLMKGKMQDILRADREKEREERRAEAEQYREARQYVDKYRTLSGNNPEYRNEHYWVNVQPNELFEKIGALYGKDANFGMRVFFGAATQNRVNDLKGNVNGNARSDAECSNDIAVLTKYAYFPNTVKKDSRLLARAAAFGEKEYDAREVADSLVSLAATGCEYRPENLDAIDLPTGVCASVLDRVVKAAKIDLNAPLRDVNGEDVRIGGDNDREAAMKLAGTCSEVCKGLAVAQNPAQAKKQPEAEDLSLKRPINPGL